MGEVSTLQFHRPWATKDEKGNWIDVFEPTIEVLFGTIEKEFTEDEVEVMQFTGLLDSKGKEIYEGDILKDRFADLIGVVLWRTSIASFGFGFPNGKRPVRETDEIIGNIYENPSLLTSSAQ